MTDSVTSSGAPEGRSAPDNPQRRLRRGGGDANARAVAARVTGKARAGDFGRVANLLRRRRDEILRRWLNAAAAQPFHAGRPERAVADHIPRLFDALVGQVERQAPPDVGVSPLLQDPAVLEEARAHARTRVGQGLTARDVLMEFRLLRQEIGRALRLHLPEDTPVADVVAAELLLHDALDDAVLLALSELDARDAEHERMEEERRRLDDEREGFALTVAHDLKNPLTAIKGTVQVLQRQVRRGDLPAGRLLAKLAAIDDASRRVTARLDELVEAVRARDDSALELHREPVNLVALARRVVDLHRVGTELHHLIVEAAQPDIVGEWDPGRIERVLDNLLGNAIKYSPRGGTVTVRLSCDAAGEQAVISVRDEGIGIPVQDIARIFERFHRAGNVGRIAGTGIGLAAVQQIVQQHGGTIRVESTLGQGSCFIVHLPLHPAREEEPGGSTRTTPRRRQVSARVGRSQEPAHQVTRQGTHEPTDERS